jgi:hypothetical protein
MAIIPLTREVNRLAGVDYIAWIGLTTNDTGEPLEAAKHSDKTAQVLGNFGSNATVTLQGSNVPVPSTNDDDWESLTDTTETALALTAKGGAQILQNYRWIRPKVTSGTSPDIDVYITAKKG